jgi:hypothetical protein
MNNEQQPDEQKESYSELYALGALSEEERETFEEFVAEGHMDMEDVRSHLESFTAICEEVAETMPSPRKALKQKILDAVLNTAEEAPPLQMFIHLNEGEWRETGIPGIAMKVLYSDPATARTTVLARLAPGAAYPSHRHMGVEECLVVQGDLVIDGRRLGAGDFTVSFQDKVHVDTHSEEGCLLLLNSPLNDEFLDLG